MFVAVELHEKIGKIVCAIFLPEHLPFLPSAKISAELAARLGADSGGYSPTEFCVDVVLHSLFQKKLLIKDAAFLEYRSARQSYWALRRKIFEPVLKEFPSFDPGTLAGLINRSDLLKGEVPFRETWPASPPKFAFSTDFSTDDTPPTDVRAILYGRASASSSVHVGITITKDGTDLADFNLEALLDAPAWLCNEKNRLATENEINAVAGEISYLLGLISDAFCPKSGRH